MDGNRRLIRKGLQPLGVYRCKVFRFLAIQTNKTDDLPVDCYRRADIGSQPIGFRHPLPAWVRIGVKYDHRLTGLQHLQQVCCAGKWKFNPHNFRVIVVLVISMRTDDLRRFTLDKQDGCSIMGHNTSNGGENMIQHLTVVQCLAECLSSITQGFCQNTLFVLGSLHPFALRNIAYNHQQYFLPMNDLDASTDLDGEHFSVRTPVHRFTWFRAKILLGRACHQDRIARRDKVSDGLGKEFRLAVTKHFTSSFIDQQDFAIQ